MPFQVESPPCGERNSLWGQGVRQYPLFAIPTTYVIPFNSRNNSLGCVSVFFFHVTEDKAKIRDCRMSGLITQPRRELLREGLT